MSGDNNYENYDLLSSVDKNNTKIEKLKNIVKNLLAYEPNSSSIKEKYPIIEN
jgi:accessory colonization factor AcfC